MTSARRYRAALLAYPTRYRRERAAELLATLADGDDDRGRPSTREAVALAYRGVAMRAHMTASPEGMTVAAAAVLLLAIVSGFGWAERVYLFRGEVAARGTDGPGLWWTLALAVATYVAIADGALGAADDPRRRRWAVWLALPLGLAVLSAPGAIVRWGITDPGGIAELVSWQAEALFHNRSLSVPMTLAAMAGTAVALPILGKLERPVRRTATGVALAGLGAVVVVRVWARPELPGYAQSALADLRPAAFIAAAGTILALTALWRRGRGSLARR